MKIPTMIVDDQPDVRLLLRMLIDRANDGLIVVAEAASGSEALQQVDDVNPMVIVMDQMMPGMTGTSTTMELRETRPTQVVILCSAFLDEEIIGMARRAGITDYVDKKEVAALPAVIRRAVGLQPPPLEP